MCFTEGRGGGAPYKRHFLFYCRARKSEFLSFACSHNQPPDRPTNPFLSPLLSAPRDLSLRPPLPSLISFMQKSPFFLPRHRRRSKSLLPPPPLLLPPNAAPTPNYTRRRRRRKIQQPALGRRRRRRRCPIHSTLAKNQNHSFLSLPPSLFSHCMQVAGRFVLLPLPSPFTNWRGNAQKSPTCHFNK